MIDLTPNNDPIFKDPVLNDIVFLIDTREQTPWDFTIFNSDSIKAMEKSATLSTGDYSLQGYEDHISIERKSLDDLLGCITNGRERFEKELRRMRGYPARAVVVESAWENLELGNWRSKVNPSSVTGSCIGWMQWGIPFHFAKSSRDATIWSARFMLMYHKRRLEELSNVSRRSRVRSKSKDGLLESRVGSNT